MAIRKTARTPEAREQQVIARAYDLAEQQIVDGTASSQIICHFLKMGSTKERIEQEQAELTKKLTEAKTKSMADAQDIKNLYQEALDSFKSYNGTVEWGNEDEDL